MSDDRTEDPLDPVWKGLRVGRPPPLRWVLAWGRDPQTGAARDPLTAAWEASEDIFRMSFLIAELRPARAGARSPYAVQCKGAPFGVCCWIVCSRVHEENDEPPEWLAEAGCWRRRCVRSFVEIDEWRCNRCIRLLRAVVGDHAPPTMAELLAALAESAPGVPR